MKDFNEKIKKKIDELQDLCKKDSVQLLVVVVKENKKKIKGIESGKVSAAMIGNPSTLASGLQRMALDFEGISLILDYVTIDKGLDFNSFMGNIGNS